MHALSRSRGIFLVIEVTWAALTNLGGLQLAACQVNNLELYSGRFRLSPGFLLPGLSPPTVVGCESPPSPVHQWPAQPHALAQFMRGTKQLGVRTLHAEPKPDPRAAGLPREYPASASSPPSL
ncbi:hypothetical protein DFP73DRAFT_531189 [Morchella snyderi]|nr:hypothetical protein DFP73DRAFT_531189 [Morchella snyderi]